MTREKTNMNSSLDSVPSHATIPSHWLILARTAWIALVVLIISFFVASFLPGIHQLKMLCTANVDCGYLQLSSAEARALQQVGLSVNFYAVYMTALMPLTLVAFLAIAAIILWRESNTWMPIFVSFQLMAFVLLFFMTPMQALVRVHPGWWLPTSLVQAFGLWSTLVFSYVFPDGQFVPRWTRSLAVIVVVLSLPIFVFTSMHAILTPHTWFEFFLLILLLGAMGTSVFAQIYRYRRVSGPVQQQQTKWVVFGLSIFITYAFGFVTFPIIFSSLLQPGLPTMLYYLVGGTLNVIFLLFLPVSIAFSILRYHLFDIDVIINRTLVYGVLTAMLALVYVGSIVGLQSLFRSLTGQESQLAVVASTLAIAALFNPLRRRVQAFIDRRFYRRKYDAAQVLATFAVTARDEVDLDRLMAELVTVVEETMQPEHVSLWLREPERKA